MKASINTSVRIFLFIFLIVLLASCNKDWLDKKSDSALVVPTTLEELQALLDNDSYMNGDFGGVNSPSPASGEMSSDDYYLLFNTGAYPTYSVLPIEEQNTYVWKKDLYNGKSARDWDFVYRSILYANIALEGVSKIDRTERNSDKIDEIKGASLFFRAMGFYNLSQLFCKQYNASTASKDLGIPLKMESSVTSLTVRSSVQQCYDQIISDLKIADELCPVLTTKKSRPSKAAVRGLLSRVYLVMGDYDNSLKYADLSLSLNGDLLDYSLCDSNSMAPFPIFNKEVVFYTVLRSVQALYPDGCKVDTLLYKEYADGDLRKPLFYGKSTDGTFYFKGTYNGNKYIQFGGIAVDELVLNKAESLARLGNKDGAMTTLNLLLSMRWDKAKFVPKTAVDSEEALKIVLTERRKELVFRGLRWTDLRRLNLDTRFAKTIKRIINDGVSSVEYILEPNSIRYVLPIPDNVIQISGIEQNVR